MRPGGAPLRYLAGQARATNIAPLHARTLEFRLGKTRHYKNFGLRLLDLRVFSEHDVLVATFEEIVPTCSSGIRSARHTKRDLDRG